MAEATPAASEETESIFKTILTFMGIHWRGIFMLVWPVLGCVVFLLGTEKKFLCLWLVFVMAGYWVTECIHLYVTGLLPVVFLPLFNIMKTGDVCLNYFKETNMVLMGSLMIATGIEYVGLHKRVAYGTILLVGCSPRRLHFGLTMATSLLSMWLMNSATTAMMCPVIFAILQELEAEGIGSVYKPLEPDDDADKPREPSNVATAYFLTAAFASSCGGIGSIVGTGPNLSFKGLFETRFPLGTKIEFVPWMLFNFPALLMMATVTWLSLEVIYMGLFRPNSEEAQIIQKGAEHKEAVEKVIKDKVKELGRMTFAEIVVMLIFLSCIVLWFMRKPQFIAGWGKTFNKVGSSTVCIAAIVLFSAIPGTVTFLKYFSQSKEERPLKCTSSMVPYKHLQKTLPWGLLLMLGGGFALAEAGKESGMSEYLGEKMSGLNHLPPFVVQCIINFVAIMATELTSNTAVCNILAPIYFEMAVAMKLNPLRLTFPVAMMCSFSFFLPVGTPPNAIVSELMNIPTTNMIKGGIILKFSAYWIYMLLFPTYGKLIFKDLDIFPDWAKTPNVTTVKMRFSEGE